MIGDVSAYCRIPDGPITAEASTFLREELQTEARALFLLVRADQAAVRSCSISLADLPGTVWLEAAPLQVGDQTFTILSFQLEAVADASPVAGLTSADRDKAFAREIERLERELLASQDTLRRSMMDLEQANQELEASSEELQASAEELQSSNEELEASNEELQATNDELAALNQQLRSRGEELQHLNTDMENIQNSLSQGMVIVDNDCRITRFSPLAVRVFGLLHSDIGHSLLGVPTTVPIPALRESLQEVIHSETRLSLEASGEEVSYLVQLMPYRNGAGQVLGGIITLTDVTELVALRRAAEASLQEFSSLADALDQVVWKRDHTLKRFLYLSRRIQALTGWSVASLCGDAGLFDAAIHPDDRPRVDAARRAGRSGWAVTYRLQCRDGELRSFSEVATVLDAANHHDVVGTLADVTDQERASSRLRLFRCAFEALRADGAGRIALLDASLQVVVIGERLAADLGCAPAELQGRSIEALAAHLQEVEPALTLSERARQALQCRQAARQTWAIRLPSSALEGHLNVQPLLDDSESVGLLFTLELNDGC